MWTFFVKNLKFTILFTLAITLVGLVSMITIDKESNPEVNIPFVVVSTPFFGASALDVEQLVTNPLEDALSGIDDLSEITSTSSLGFSSIGLEFEIGADIDKKLQETREAITRAEGGLPGDAGDVVAQQVSFDDAPIKVYVIGGPYETAELKQDLDLVVSQLERIPGLTEARVIGGQEEEIQVAINPARLAQYSLSIDQVTNSLRQAETNIPVGVIERGNAQYSLRFDGRITSVDQISDIPVGSFGGETVLLSDIGSVRVGFEESAGSARLYKDGAFSNALTIQIFKKSEGNVLDVVDAADAVVNNAIGDILPEDVVVETVDDMADFIRTDLVNLGRNGLQTTIIVVLLILVLLGWREALLAGLSIPLTFFITFLGLQALGYTLNFLSLFSLILALGILVDAGIVMTEGVYENKQSGLPPFDAAIKTIQEFKAPLISGTATTIFAFLPMILTSGIIGEFIKSIPVTVTIVLLAALFVAIALIPAFFVILLGATGNESWTGRLGVWVLRAIILVSIIQIATASSIASLVVSLVILGVAVYEMRSRNIRTGLVRFWARFVLRFRTYWSAMEVRRDGIVDRTRSWYQGVIRRLLANRRVANRFFVILVGAFFGAMALPALGVLKVDMFPATDMDQVYVDITMPSGSTLEVTESVIAEVDAYFANRPEVASFLTTVGSGSSLSGGSGADRAGITLTLVDRAERKDSRDYLDVYTNAITPLVLPGSVAVQQVSGGPESGSPVELKIVGDDLEVLERLALEWEDVVAEIDGVRNVSTSIEDAPGEIAFTFDRAQLNAFGVASIQLATTLRAAVSGTEVFELRQGDEDVPVVVRMDIAGANQKDIQLEQLLALPIATPRGISPLSTFVDSEFGVDRTSVTHESGSRIVRVTSGVATGFVAADIFAEIERALEEYAAPEGYAFSLGGQNEETDQSFADLGRAMFLGIFMIAALLVWQFNSYRQPLMIISSIPMSLIGVFPGLSLVGQPLSFPGMIGVVALAGIVVNNGIILVDRINENRRSGMPTEDAVVESCSARLRPILLTTVTTVAGLLPLVLSEPSWAPLGFAIIFGLLFSTVLTLISLPLQYARFAEKTIA